ncbi:MAG: HAD family phosphatase [Hyphomicrobiales bacterium]|nr:HAD family phosphatase [Hyphomicrobiales bacterium]
MTPIRHVVFDLGGVLLHWDAEIPFRRLIPDDEERSYFLTEICSRAWNAEQDRGRSWEEAEAVLVEAFPQHESMIRAYRIHWPEMVPYHHADSVTALEVLLDNAVDVTALTNFAADTFEVARGRYPFLRRFRGVTVSGQVGLVKPDAAIYRHHHESLGLDPATTLFFDDVAANVEGAQSAGWQAERFESPEKLLDDLARYGLPTA